MLLGTVELDAAALVPPLVHDCLDGLELLSGLAVRFFPFPLALPEPLFEAIF